mmetsp:Transcript_23864/g.43434  ORF Transcript_23864/g.43434 Transcript_23864/m.43434 type:complete len:83 (-) Transcript_23864:685-933(-)
MAMSGSGAAATERGAGCALRQAALRVARARQSALGLQTLATRSTLDAQQAQLVAAPDVGQLARLCQEQLLKSSLLDFLLANL